MRISVLNRCRACGCTQLKQFLNLPSMPLTDDFISESEFGSEFRHDIPVFVCLECSTVQTQHDLDMADYYEDYQYAVGGSQSAASFMQKLAKNLHTRFLAGQQRVRVLEVGSGDGTQLSAFKAMGCDVLGFEPSAELVRTAQIRGIPTLQGLFVSDSVRDLPEEFKHVDVVLLSYTLDHLPEPRNFIKAAKSILSRRTGLLVAEVHDLEKILSRREYCLFEHEHSIYLTKSSATKLCEREGMTIIDFDLVAESDRRANSLIFVATPNGSELEKRFPAADSSLSASFDNPDFYMNQAENIKNGIENLDAFVKEVAASGKSIAGYGAGGRGVMTLAAMKTADKLSYLVDKKPKRPGLVTPKSGIPVVGLSALKESPVDEILVFSFGYMAEIQNDLAPYGYQSRQFHSLLDVLSGTARI